MEDENILEWERIDTTQAGSRAPAAITERCAVPGGWLVRQLQLDHLGGLHSVGGITFMPDISHEWDIYSDYKD